MRAAKRNNPDFPPMQFFGRAVARLVDRLRICKPKQQQDELSGEMIA
jgi:hypothetical protein